MSANIAHIDLNSDLVLGDRELDGHGDYLSVSEGVHLNQRGQVKNSSTDHFANLCPPDASGGALLESGADGEAVGNGLKRKSEFDENYSYGELDVRPDFRAAPSSMVDDVSSMQTIIALDRDEEGGHEGERVPSKSPGVDADSITDDENGLVLRLSCGSLNSIHADPLSCREAKRKKFNSSEGVTEVKALNCVDEFCLVEDKGNKESLVHLQIGKQSHMKKASNEGSSFSICVDRKSEDTRSSERFDFLGSLNSGCPQAPAEVSQITDLPEQDTNLNKTVATGSSQYETMIVVDGQLTNESLALNLFNMVVDLNPCVVRKEKAMHNENEKSSVSSAEFHASDLVWGKVRSHPWWPGQILDPSASSKKAEKYFKKGSYLIAYFGDQTFAWNEVSLIKPFQEHFSQLEKQSTLERFHHAIDCALEEVSGRVEFGLACHCLSSELYSNLENQIIINAGSREGSIRRDAGDRNWGSASFNPGMLVSFIKSVAQFPHGEDDRLELEIVRAQTLSFSRWKGYSELPEFRDLGGLLEYGELQEEKQRRAMTEDAAREVTSDKHALSEKRNEKTKNSTGSKRRLISGNRVYPSEREKKLLDLRDEKLFHSPMGENKVHEGTNGRLISNTSVKEGKRSDSVFEDRVRYKKDHSPVASPEKNAKTNQIFRVGASIQRVATKLNGLNPIQMRNNGSSYKTVVENKEKSHNGKPVDSELYSVDEVLSQLCSAATKPTKGNNSMSTMLSFLSDFRNSVIRINSSQKQASGGDTKIKSPEFGKGTVKSSAKETGLEIMNDSHSADLFIHPVPEEDPRGKDISAIEEPASDQVSLNPDCKQPVADLNLSLEVDKSAEHLVDNSKIGHFCCSDS